MAECFGPVGAHLQNKVDQKHSNDLKRQGEDVAKINYELRHVLQHLKTDFTKRLHNPSHEGDHDLTEHNEQFEKLRSIYRDFMQNSLIEEGNHSELRELYSGDLQAVSPAELEKIIRHIDDIEQSHKDNVQDTTQQLYLLGQLFITVTDIIRKMDEGQRRFMERISEKVGVR